LIRPGTFVKPKWVILVLLLILSVSLNSCYRIIRSEEIPADDGPVMITGVLMAYGGAMANWSENDSVPGMGPNLVRLQISPGGPPEIQYAYVAIDNVIPTLNDLEKLQAKYFILPHSTLDWSPYFCICFDLDGDNTGCDAFLLGEMTSPNPKNQWNTLEPSTWSILGMEGEGESFTLEELKGIHGNKPIIRIRVSVGTWDTLKSLTVLMDGITINDTIYNLEPGELSPQGNQPFVD
jgi:hypothetical protein